jgi:hypothetical protein|tara:strand:- start:340 stop:564 length:225 start_codon:yes stop_codon:yes gene_type:complete
VTDKSHWDLSTGHFVRLVFSSFVFFVAMFFPRRKKDQERRDNMNEKRDKGNEKRSKNQAGKLTSFIFPFSFFIL